ncbi:regulatory protein RecX [Bifidobacterium aerophilum]|uniref:Regulatory protein RecX n=1 Tax=Bifidobacterium aerophilum TaxID=1798155 RepID=A0A6N9Z568_9BIFI|nr:RecX family transcriptional regulator [Bifidobacterium aerophilum]
MISAEEFLVRHPVRMPDRTSVVGNRNDRAPDISDTSPRSARDASGGTGDDVMSESRDRGLPRRRATSFAARQAAPEDPSDADECREAALRLLDAAPRSSGALRERLLDKGYDGETVDAVIERLIEVNLLDDEYYARSAVRYCTERLMGARGAFMELLRKGVDRDAARRAVDEADARGVFEESAWELGRRYARKTEGMEPNRRRQRFWSAGGRKGHDPETLRRVAQELL